ncbi:MAG: hypothetical protein A2583_04250 [Bdellovibrionales bacterium RIFOXYD1_FULL_53_11]|nr:MAG: hypothetical protein A2583_04250 [Bdellovibrionales bacterium RIFOXYD1_FULL_53_11]
MHFKTLLGLLFCNFVWSANPAMAKVLLAGHHPVHVAWFRYGSALAAFFIIALVLRAAKGRTVFAVPRGRVEWFWLFVLGLLTFCLTPFLHMTGLSKTTAVDGVLVVVMEPLVTALLASFFLGERLGRRALVAFAIAMGGFILLSGGDLLRDTSGIARAGFFGNIIMLFSVISECTYSVAGKKLMLRHEPLGVFGAGLFTGVAVLTILMVITVGMPSFEKFGTREWLALLWMGPLGTTVGYAYWLVALVRVPVALVVLTLFFQPVLGALWGTYFLGEQLTIAKIAGGLVIVFAVLWHATRGKRME